jgi:hypothetical protein
MATYKVIFVQVLRKKRKSLVSLVCNRAETQTRYLLIPSRPLSTGPQRSISLQFRNKTFADTETYVKVRAYTVTKCWLSCMYYYFERKGKCRKGNDVRIKEKKK